MPTETKAADAPKTRAELGQEYRDFQGAIKALTDKGGDELANLTAEEAGDLAEYLDARDQVEAELKALPDPAAVKARVQAGDAFLKTPVSRPKIGGDGAGVGRTGDYTQPAMATGGEPSEAEKWFQTGPFKSLAHFMYATKRAGGQPGTSDHGVIAEYRAGMERYDGAIKALACRGVDTKAHGEVKAITGLGEFLDSEGGLLIPPQFAAGIWQRSVAQMRIAPLLEMIPVTGNSLTIRAYQDKSRADGSRYGGVTGYWTGEASQYTSSKPTFRTIESRLSKLTVLVYVTEELLDDTTAAESEINRVAGEEIAFKTDDALFRGTGVGMPLGVLNAPCKVTQAAVSGQGATTIIAKNIDAMWARRGSPQGSSYVWLANQDTETQLAQLNYTVAGTNSIAATWLYLPEGGITGAPTPKLKGRPVYFVEQAETLGTEGDLVLFDPTQYVAIVKSTGIQQAVSMHLRFDFGEVAYKFSYRMDARPRWEAPLTRFKGSNTLSPVLTLNSSRT
jgi:HK97 family phage major capsid protein